MSDISSKRVWKSARAPSKIGLNFLRPRYLVKVARACLKTRHYIINFESQAKSGTTIRKKPIHTPYHPLENQAMHPLHPTIPEADPQVPPQKLPSSAINHSLCSHLPFQVDLHEASWPWMGRIFYGKEDR